MEVLDDLNSLGKIFITGGDLNSIPPDADSTDYCMEDKCEGENFHENDEGSRNPY